MHFAAVSSLMSRRPPAKRSGVEGFKVDLSSYMSSNGVFTLHFPEWVAPRDKSLFFKVVIKEYEHK